jgi:hypothetical protein
MLKKCLNKKSIIFFEKKLPEENFRDFRRNTSRKNKPIHRATDTSDMAHAIQNEKKITKGHRHQRDGSGVG